MSIVGGTQSLVNLTTAQYQGNAAITGLADGGWVVAWQSYGQDGSDNGVYQQRYDASGTAVGGETLVNTNLYLDQAEPSITALEGGGWVVTWQSYYQYYSDWSVYQQAYDANGGKIGGETLVSSGGAAAVAGLPDGGWITAWSSYGEYVYYRTYSGTGSAETWSVSLQSSYYYNSAPVITVLEDGGWVAVWVNRYYGDSSGASVIQQRFDASGNKIGVTEQRVNSMTAGDQSEPSVAALADGGWLVAWTSATQNGEGTNIYLQRYDGSGRAIGAETLVNTTVAGNQSAPAVSVLANGNWVVVWQGNGAGDDSGIYQQVFTANGTRVGDEYLVNTVVTGSQTAPAITALADGSWVVSWGGSGDEDDQGVYQRAFSRGDIDAEGRDASASVSVASSHTLSIFDFQDDVDLNSSIVVTALPAAGLLALDGVPVVEGQAISVLDIRNGLLIWSMDGDDPEAGLSISFAVLDDGETYTGGESVNVLTLNFAPTLVNAIAAQSVDEDSLFTFTVPSDTFADLEGDALTYTATLANGAALPSWLAFDPATRTFSGTPLDANVGTIAVRVTATDAAGGRVDGNFSLVVSNTYDAPTATTGGVYWAMYEDCSNWDWAAYWFKLDAGHPTVTYSLELADGTAPSWATINSQGYVVFAPTNDQVGGYTTLWLKATDDIGGVGKVPFYIYVYNVNDAPTVANPIPNRAAFEDTAFNFQFAADAFIDVDIGDTLTYSAVLADGAPLPSWLSFDPATRTFSGTPDNGDVGVLTVKVTAKDTTGATANTTFTLEVANVNDAPLLINPIASQTATEDSEFSLLLGADVFADIDAGDTLTYSATLADGAPLPSWLSFDPVTRTFSGTPATDADAGTISVKVTVRDSADATASDTFDIVVAAINDAPVVADAIANQNATEDSPFDYQFSSTVFADEEGDALTYSASLANGDPLPSWLSFDAATRTFSGTPDNGDVGDITVVVTAQDSHGGEATDTFTITVANTNDAPTLANALTDQGATEDAPFTFQIPSDTFADIDVGDTLAYSAKLENGDPLPAWLSFDPATGIFSGTPENGDVGTLTIEVTADDDHGETATGTFTITIANTNDAPVVAHAIVDQVATEDAAFNFQIPSDTFADVDAGDSLTYSASLGNGDPLPSWLSFDAATRTFSGTPDNGDVGSILVSVTATDEDGEQATETFTIAIANTNDAPTVANALISQDATEDAPFTFQIPSDTFADMDAGDTLTYSAQLAGGGALPSWLSFDPATRTFSGTPENGDVGALAIEVIADDGHGGTATDTFTITIANTNDRPVVTNAIASQIATEDSAFTFQIPLDTFADVDAGDTLTYSASLENGDPLPSWLSFDAATRTFSGTPDNGDVGDIAVVVTAQDGHGGEATDTFTITVANTNDAPTLANALTNQSATEDSAFIFQIPSDTFADMDVDDTLTYVARLADGGALPTWLSFDPATRTFSGTPENGDVGALAIEVIADDGHGETATGTFTITIANTNDAPVVANAIASQIATEDAAFTFQIPPGTFADVDTGDSLTYSASLENGDPLPAWLSFDPMSRTFSGTPDNDDVGPVSITVIADDGHGGTATETFTITVANSNDAPVVSDVIQWQIATEDSAFGFQVPADAFADIDAGDTLVYSARLASGDPLPSWLSFDAATRTFSGTPDNGDVGALSVELTVSDGHGGSVSQIFGIVVDNTNDAPVAGPAIADRSVLQDQSFLFQFAADTFADPDIGDELTYTARLANGNALPAWLDFDAATRTFSGTPADQHVGTLSIVITADDGRGGTAATAFEITVEDVNDAPTAAGSTITIKEDTAHAFSLADFGFDDPDGDGFAAIVIGELPGAGTLRLNGSAATAGQRIEAEDIAGLTWTPKANANGKDYASFTFFVADDGGTANAGTDLSVSLATITFDVTEVVDRFIGGKGKQNLVGTTGEDILSGGKGNDKLKGNDGADTFIFKTGFDRDVIRDFEARGDDHDILDLSGLKSVTGFKDLMKNHLEVHGKDLWIDGGKGDVVILEDVRKKHLDIDDFIF